MFDRQRENRPENYVNTFRRFGRFGPAYQIIGVSKNLRNDDTIMKIQIFETNEFIEYPLSNILKDLIED